MPQVHVAPSTKILDVQQITPGGRRLFEVLPRASRTKANANGTYSNVFDLGNWSFLQILLDVYATSVTDAGDVLDLTVQLSTTEAFTVAWNVGLFTQQAGNGVAAREVMTLTTAKAVDEDAIFAMVAAAGVVDEKTFGRYMRVLIAITDADANAIHQFGIEALIQ